jgi:hypothetical protein
MEKVYNDSKDGRLENNKHNIEYGHFINKP